MPNNFIDPGSTNNADLRNWFADPVTATPQSANMMCLGDFVFTLKTVPYQTRADEWSWRHPENSRVGAAPAFQFAGKNADTIKLSGELYPELTGGMVSLKELKDMADTGQAYTLIDGLYNVAGQFVIEKISSTRTNFFDNGVARRIEFSIDLKKVEDDDEVLKASALPDGADEASEPEEVEV